MVYAVLPSRTYVEDLQTFEVFGRYLEHVVENLLEILGTQFPLEGHLFALRVVDECDLSRLAFGSLGRHS